MERRIVAIVGSSKFKAEHLGVAQRETLRGSIVLLAGFRTALKHANVGHRGWGPHIDREVDGLLRGTGYELREVR